MHIDATRTHARPFGPKEIDGVLLPSGKTYILLTDHLITGKMLWFESESE